MEVTDELKLITEAVRKAGQIVKDGYGQNLEITIKGDPKNIATQIDQASEKAIIETLQASSDYPILAEESGKSGELGDTFWVIDPLDGTTNFSRGIPFFSVSVALVKEEKVVCGATLNPLTGDLYFAQKGKGAYLNDLQIKVSDKTEGAIVILNQGYSEEAILKYRQTVEKLGPLYILRRLGSSCLEYCMVASGVVEGFVSFGDKLWDYAAGMIIIEEAGGKVTDWKGNPWSVWSPYVLSSNQVVYEKLKENVEDLQ